MESTLGLEHSFHCWERKDGGELIIDNIDEIHHIVSNSENELRARNDAERSELIDDVEEDSGRAGVNEGGPRPIIAFAECENDG